MVELVDTLGLGSNSYEWGFKSLFWHWRRSLIGEASACHAADCEFKSRRFRIKNKYIKRKANPIEIAGKFVPPKNLNIKSGKRLQDHINQGVLDFGPICGDLIIYGKVPEGESLSLELINFGIVYFELKFEVDYWLDCSNLTFDEFCQYEYELENRKPLN